jgi:heme/copper-type cytochrome/quinol oxidase subunit 2
MNNNIAVFIGLFILVISFIFMLVWFVKYDRRYDDSIDTRVTQDAGYWIFVIGAIVFFILGAGFTSYSLYQLNYYSEKHLPDTIKLDIIYE